MCVTKASADRTGITAIADLADPDMAKNFDTNGDGLGEVWVGASGWASTNIEKIRAKSYGYDETMELLEMDEALAMADLDAAGRKGCQPRLLLLYAQSHVRAVRSRHPGRARVRRLQVGRSSNRPTTLNGWRNRAPPVAWDLAYLHVHYAASLEESHPEAAALLSKVVLTTDQVSHMTFGLVVEKIERGRLRHAMGQRQRRTRRLRG